jgi:hypothetical protein
VRDNLENNQVQVKLFRDLRALLEVKMNCLRSGGDDGLGERDDKAVNYDRFVLRD